MNAANTADLKWERMFKVLRIFVRSNGHCDVPPNPAPDSLGRWLAEQRRQHQAGRLPAGRIRRLEALGFLLAPAHGGRGNNAWAASRFELNYAKLVAFKKRFGHCRVQAHWSEDPGFGHWVANQRIARHQDKLAPERIQRLDALGFCWSGYFDPAAPAEAGVQWVGARDDHWGCWLAALAGFKKKHGHCQVPPGDGMGGKLHAWVVRCRMQGNQGSLRPDRRLRLEALGFEWSGGRANQDRWERRFAQLVAYQKKFGHCDVPMRWPKDRGLAHWVSNQRWFRRRGKLAPERIERLDRIGFSWTTVFHLDAPPGSFQKSMVVLDARWERQFAELVKYQKQHGDCRPPLSFRRGRLFRWVKRQREHWRAGRLPAAWQARLDKLGFSWKPVNPAWEHKFTMLLAYKKRFGHCNLPRSWPENQPLATWVRHQREYKRHGKLIPERVARLKAIGFNWGKQHRVKRTK